MATPPQQLPVPGERASRTISAGTPIVVGLAGAGTDPARFGGEAGRFDISRGQETHLGSAAGRTSAWGRPWPGWRPASR
ncbi:hypothetical protein [Nonomuraea sp. NPDC049695]|uniref:hypothetical protein n=1 Tax=Nonomuraea sp. NPDC049695 TaxID=3154734 RepID=UPI00344A8D67